MDNLIVSDLYAHTYNAAVNAGTPRGIRKMDELIEAINRYERIRGREKLEALVEAGVITEWKPCGNGCEVRRGGLFHEAGCENEMNHPVYRARQAKAREVLTKGTPNGIHDGYWDASVSLVGE